MANLLEYVGSVHIFLGPYRGNPIALYLKRTETGCQIGPKVYPWNDVVGAGETPNKAAADFEDKWKGKGLSADMYSGPSWEGGIKPEKPAPPKPAVPPKPAAAAPAAGAAPAAPGVTAAPAVSKPTVASAGTAVQAAPAKPAASSPTLAHAETAAPAAPAKPVASVSQAAPAAPAVQQTSAATESSSS